MNPPFSSTLAPWCTAYENKGLAPGRYVARLRIGEGVMRQELVIAAGVTTKVTLRLP